MKYPKISEFHLLIKKKKQMKSIIFSLLFLFSSCVFSQKTSFPVATIPDSLKQNANAVLRVYDVEIEIYVVIVVFYFVTL